MTRPPAEEADSEASGLRREFKTPGELGAGATAIIADGILTSAAKERPYLLGCPGGRTPRVIYDALARRCADQRIDYSGVVIVMMDEYLEPGSPTLTMVSPDAHNSCRRFAEYDIRRVINRDLPTDMGIPRASIWLPDPTEPSRYDQQIADAGGVDLFLVASGASDGHVAFCGPGSNIDGITAIVTLAAATRYDSAWPATFIHECREAQIWTDAAASPRRPERNEAW